MATKYDEEEYTYYKLEMFNSLDVAEKGKESETRIGYYEEQELPSPELIAKEARKHGYDSFEVTHTTDRVYRYTVD